MTRRRGIGRACCLGGFGGLLGFAAMAMVGIARFHEFDRARASVERRLELTSRGDVLRWAPERLQEARAAYRSAQRTRNAARASLWPLPDLSPAHADLERALTLIEKARILALESEREERQTAQEAIESARLAVERSRAWVQGFAPVGAARRQSASGSLALVEARALFAEREYTRSKQRAVEALRIARRVHGHAGVIVERYADAEQVQIWRRWAREAIDASRKSADIALVVWKADHMLQVYKAGRVFRQYDAELSYNWIERKRWAGDGAIPEGLYQVSEKKQGAETLYHRALLLDYPNVSDRQRFARAKRSGEIRPSASIGGLIEIHGEGGRGFDWTRGCVAVRNHEIDELFDMVRVGTPVALVGASRPLSPEDLVGIRPAGGRLE